MTQANLCRMRRLIRETRKLTWRIEREKSYATKSTSTLSLVPKGGRRDFSRVEEGSIRIIYLKDAYREATAELDKLRDALEPLINELEDTDEKAVMRLRYLQGFQPEDIANAIFRTDRMVYYILSRAEKKIVRMFPDDVA